ncbi:MAG TPA: cytochrome P450 [Anaerolineales bacterium]|nr:cytochrome P450 [Anaerolineales bacterium]
MQPNKITLPASLSSPIPGPDGFPFVGILPKIGRDPLKFFVEMMNEYGDLVRLDFGSREMYLLTDPEGIKYVLQDNNRNYAKGYHQVKPVLGEGLVSAEGEFWRRQRRLIQPHFHRAKIEGFSSVITDLAAERLASWDAYSRTSTPFDLAQEMVWLTQQIIASTMFSTDVGIQTEALCEAFDVTLEYMNMRLFSPFDFIDRLPLPTNRRFKKALRTLDEIMFGLIENRRRGANRPEDLLTMLIEARDPETGEGMDDRQIRDEVVTIFFAGHETTASTLSWTGYLLAQHPEAVVLLQEEVARTVGDRTPAFNDYPSLNYTRQVIDESLRIYPPAWMFARTAIMEDEVSGYHIPAGAMIMLSPYATHRHPKYWQGPERFDPDRFRPEASATRHKMAYFPFGGGPRLCIGKDFALVEATLILTMMVQQYNFSLVPGQHVKAQPIATLRPRPGVQMMVSPRGA